jgi:hypothetical protein
MSRIKLALLQARDLVPNLDRELNSLCAELDHLGDEDNKNKDVSDLIHAMKEQNLPDSKISEVILEAYDYGPSIQNILLKELSFDRNKLQLHAFFFEDGFNSFKQLVNAAKHDDDLGISGRFVNTPIPQVELEPALFYGVLRGEKQNFQVQANVFEVINESKPEERFIVDTMGYKSPRSRGVFKYQLIN